MPRPTPTGRAPTRPRRARSPATGLPGVGQRSRTPFVLLVIGLLAGGLVSLLLLNTMLAQGSFTLDSLQQRHTHLVHRMEALEREVANQSSPGSLARKARSLGMVPTEKSLFVDPETGAVYGPSGRTSSKGGG